MEDRWLSVDEIGGYLGVKRDTVYKWISEKSMPAHKIGRLWKFKKNEIDGGYAQTEQVKKVHNCVQSMKNKVWIFK